MTSTILLAKGLGLVLVVVGAAVVFRRRFLLPVFAEYVRQRLVRITMSMIELLAGVFLVVAHPHWSPFPAAVITLLGWMMLAEALFYLFVPDPWLERFMRTFNTAPWYVIGGSLAMLAGVYLAGFGFGWW